MARIDFDAQRNRYAVYEGAVNDSKLLDPLNNLAQMKFHSDLDYIGAVRSWTLPINLDVRTWPGGVTDRAIVAHGLPYAPLILGTVYIGGQPVPAQGDFVVRMQSGVVSYNIYATQTHIRIAAEPMQFSTSFRSTPVTLELHACNVGVGPTGGVYKKTPYPGLDVTPNRLRAGYFDTEERHFIANSAGDVMFYTGPSMDLGLGYLDNDGGSYIYLGFEFRVLNYAVSFTVNSGAGDAGFISGTNPNFRASVIRTDCT